jgi:hypothetical protein
MVNDCVAVALVASVTSTVKVSDAAVEPTVPEIAPDVALSESPVGKVPVVILHV